MGKKRDVLDTIKGWVLSGEWSAGMEIREAEIEELLKVSRPPVREALSVLAADGWIERVPGKGTTVRQIDEKEVGEALALRFAVESFVGRTLSKLPSYFVEELTKPLDKMRELAAAKKVVEFVRADYEFHCAMAKQAGLGMFVEVLEKCQTRSQLFRTSSARRSPEMQAIIQEHEAILRAVVSRDRDAIELAVAEHLMKAAERSLPPSTLPFLRHLFNVAASATAAPTGSATTSASGKGRPPKRSRATRDRGEVHRAKSNRTKKPT